MAERTRNGRPVFPGSAALGEAASEAGQRFAWIWSRESLLRLLLALVLATALWLYVTSKTNPSTIDLGQPIPVATQNLPDHLTVTNPLQQVHISYRSDNPNAFVAPSNFHAFVNLFGYRPGSATHVKVQVISDLSSVTVAKTNPAYIAVNIQPVQIKQIPVRARLSANLPEGYEAGNVTLQPDLVTVRGPQSLISEVSQAVVGVNLAGAQTSVQAIEVPVLEDSQGTSVSSSSLHMNPSTVQVTLPIRSIKSFKTLPLLVPGLKGQPKAGFSVVGVSVSPAELTAHGLPKVLDSLSSASTLPVSISGAGGGKVVRKVRVHLPKGVSSPTSFATVTIMLKPLEASSSIQVAVVAQNIFSYLTPHVQPAYVLATVVGPSTGLHGVARKMTATIDMTGYGQGTFTRTPQVTAPAGFSVKGIYPQFVTVTLQPSRPS